MKLKHCCKCTPCGSDEEQQLILLAFEIKTNILQRQQVDCFQCKTWLVSFKSTGYVGFSCQGKESKNQKFN